MNIPPDLLAKYKAYEITSEALAAATGYHPVSLRRAIHRERPPKPADRKKDLRHMRELYRISVADRPIRDIMRLANVSISTAYRIRKMYGRA